MSSTDCLRRIIAAGYSGIEVWEGTKKNKWCGCLKDNDIHLTPLHETNLWEYVETVEEVFELLADYAEERADAVRREA